MGYWVKRCSRCKAANDKAIGYCVKCGADLPVAAELSDTPPLPLPAYAMPPPPAAAPVGPLECRVVDVDVPFWSLVQMMVKVAVASIPALVVLTVYAVFAMAVLAAIGYSMR